MNAMTGPDYTLYPFATPNQADFYNLLAVYLDSVFKPLLKEQDFRQDFDENIVLQTHLWGIFFERTF